MSIYTYIEIAVYTLLHEYLLDNEWYIEGMGHDSMEKLELFLV